jgi:hypothetical protein
VNRACLVGLLAATVLAGGLVQVPGDASHQAAADPGPELGERVFVLSMEGNAFNGETWPDTPLLEAYAGEELTFLVLVPPRAEMHTFHLHGHPWEDPGQDRTIDTVMLDPGESHAFRVTAGLEAGHAGEWLYHCHVSEHFAAGMWGLLKVYPYAMQVDGPLEELTVELSGEDGPVTGASFEAHLREEQGPVAGGEVGEGTPVEVDVEERGGGSYELEPRLPADAGGQLVLTSHHDRGESRARLDLTADGYETVRDVEPANGAAEEALGDVGLAGGVPGQSE